ncbi:MAG: FAD-dependent oxidoreductase, partial [Actinobacteria bacterium]|nr:FAD-dependent oxidoreductase [Actinomycetota bacterium]
MENFDHIVVGGGAMGAATAWQLVRRGHSVALIEQFGIAHDRGSSHGGARIFRFAYRNPLYAQLAIDSLSQWRELEAETGEVLLEQLGQLDHGVAPAIDEIEQSLRRFDRPFERISGADAHQRWPGMKFDEHVIFSPDGGRCFADRTVRALYRRFEELGGRVFLNVRVEDIEISGDVATVVTAEGTFRTHSVVVAAGAWVDKLVGSQVALPPMRVDVGQPLHYQPFQEFADPTLWPSFIHHTIDKDATSVVAGSTYGMYTPGEGVKVGREHVAPAIDPDDRDFALNQQWLAIDNAYVKEWLPGVDVSSATATTCLFTNTPDADFIIDRI